MSSSLSALTLYAKTVIDSQGWLTDPNIVPLPWREVELPQKLCFGILMDDGVVKPLPPVTRALRDTRKKLEAAGHTVIEYTPCVFKYSLPTTCTRDTCADVTATTPKRPSASSSASSKGTADKRLPTSLPPLASLGRQA
jgi:Asp-tRNA(Asn)/Glu-tRNA(Gln) amidotransferase A subunit family amidase